MTRAGIDIAGTADAQDSVSGESVATARFRPISNPATSERIQFTAIAEDNGEDIVRFDWRSLPGGAITEHVHPHQEERFTVIAGDWWIPSTSLYASRTEHAPAGSAPSVSRA